MFEVKSLIFQEAPAFKGFKQDSVGAKYGLHE